MNEESNNQKLKTSTLLMPILSISIFFVLIFGAGYAYFTMDTSKAANTANGNVTMPSRPTLICNKTDATYSVPIANMIQGKAGNIAGTVAPKLACECKGSGNCLFNVAIASSTFTSVSGKENEVTVMYNVNKSAGSTCANKAAANYAAGTVLTNCTVAAGQTLLVTATVNFYNIASDQNSRQGATYVFSLTSSSAGFVA